MMSYSTTDKVIDNVHRYARFYLASVLTGLLALLLLLSSRLEAAAAVVLTTGMPPSESVAMARCQGPAGTAARHLETIRTGHHASAGLGITTGF